MLKLLVQDWGLSSVNSVRKRDTGTVLMLSISATLTTFIIGHVSMEISQFNEDGFRAQTLNP